MECESKEYLVFWKYKEPNKKTFDINVRNKEIRAEQTTSQYNRTLKLGVYATKERAQEVIGEIENFISAYKNTELGILSGELSYRDFNHECKTVYKMPKE